jgi:hypothetical protein
LLEITGRDKNKTAQQCDPPNGYPRHASCLGSFLARQESRHGQPSVIADVGHTVEGNTTESKPMKSNIRLLIENHDYIGLFGWGYCYHFAIAVHEDLKLPIFGLTRTVTQNGVEKEVVKHVWGKWNEFVVDIYGANYEDVIKSMLDRQGIDVIRSIGLQELQDLAKSRTTEIEDFEMLILLAKSIIGNHVRYRHIK